MQDKYRHSHLPGPGYTRIIILEPSGDSSAPVQCRLELLFLDECGERNGPYTALSYSWDAEKPSFEIDCQGYAMHITPNCKAAIRELRGCSQPKTLWVDSICIDQGADSDAIRERNGQVALMSRIYKAAQQVVAWVGKSDIRTEKAVNLISAS